MVSRRSWIYVFICIFRFQKCKISSPWDIRAWKNAAICCLQRSHALGFAGRLVSVLLISFNKRVHFFFNLSVPRTLHRSKQNSNQNIYHLFSTQFEAHFGLRAVIPWWLLILAFEIGPMQSLNSQGLGISLNNSILAFVKKTTRLAEVILLGYLWLSILRGKWNKTVMDSSLLSSWICLPGVIKTLWSKFAASICNILWVEKSWERGTSIIRMLSFIRLINRNLVAQTLVYLVLSVKQC